MTELSFKVYKNCYALPIRHLKSEDGVNHHGGGLCCDGIWIKESALFPGSLTTYEFDTNSVEFIDEDIVFLGYMSPVWGHAITDCLKHLWWFQTEEYKKNHVTKKIYYWGPKPLSGVFSELVRLSGVDLSRLHFIDHEMLFRSVTVPDISFNYTDGWARNEYADTIELIVSNVKPHKASIEKLFLSERESHRNWGIKNLERLAISAGYKVYYPAEHSLQDQISLLRSAKNILSFESSVGHSTVFCHPRTKLVMLRKENYANKYQSIINVLRCFDVKTINASLSLMNDERFPYAGPFFVYPNEAVCDVILSPQDQQDETTRVACNKQKSATLFPWRSFKKYINYHLYLNEQDLAHILTIPEEKAECFSQEIAKYRNWQLERTRRLFNIVPLPNKIKEKAIIKVVKYKVRHLF